MEIKKVLVIGGAGYVGSALVPTLLGEGYEVTVFDTYWYGDVFHNVDSANLRQIKGDVRDKDEVVKACRGTDAIIHLACISNDPSFNLDPNLGRSINYDAFLNILEGAKVQGVKRLIYASSSSVYGIKEEKNVTEDSAPEPLTDYSKYKWECEKMLREKAGGMDYVIVRPATVCGYARRLRLDLTVNILTKDALEKGVITIDGDGKHLRPNINIKDMVRAYSLLLSAPSHKIRGRTFNAGYENHSIEEIALIVKGVIGDHVELRYRPEAKDQRSYHINSDKIRRELGFVPLHKIEDAVLSLKTAYDKGDIVNALHNPLYYNIERMKELKIS